jgi:F-type H+-transporting ATPase subunit epsilon
MAHTFHLTIAKVGENLFDGEAASVTLPGVEGEFTVLAYHEAFVSELKEGVARIKSAEGTTSTIPVVHGGIAEVSHNQATVLL